MAYTGVMKNGAYLLGFRSQGLSGKRNTICLATKLEQEIRKSLEAVYSANREKVGK